MKFEISEWYGWSDSTGLVITWAMPANEQTGVAEGMNIFRYPDQVYISALAVPGVSYGDVVEEGLEICAERGDCVFLIDPPNDVNLTEVISYHKGDSTVTGRSFDIEDDGSSFGICAYPWVEVPDPEKPGERIDVPPSGFYLRNFARVDAGPGFHYAPAGQKNGLIDGLATGRYLSGSAMEQLYDTVGYGNTINPIIRDVSVGLMFWGNRTMLSTSVRRVRNALDRIGVRRVMCRVRHLVRRVGNQVLFDPFVGGSVSRVKGLLTEILTPLVDGESMTIQSIDVRLIDNVGGSDLKGVEADVHVTPTGAIEVFLVNMTVHNQGVSVTETAV